MNADRAKAERIVAALCLAETIPFSVWKSAATDRQTIRDMTRKGTDNLVSNYESMTAWVESVLRE